MPKLTVEPGTPPWWGRAVDALERAKADRPSQPTKFWRAANTAALPPAADYPGCVAYNVVLAAFVISDGTYWYPLSVGAHL